MRFIEVGSLVKLTDGFPLFIPPDDSPSARVSHLIYEPSREPYIEEEYGKAIREGHRVKTVGGEKIRLTFREQEYIEIDCGYSPWGDSFMKDGEQVTVGRVWVTLLPLRFL